MKVVLTYRVLQHWRAPVFQRLARWPGVEFVALHGADIPGTKAINAKVISGFSHRQLMTVPFNFAFGGDPRPMPFCPGIPIHLWRIRPDVILAEGGSNLLNNFLVFGYSAMTRTPVVWWTLGELQGPPPKSIVQRVFRGLTRLLERRATAYLGYSSVALQYFERQGYPREKQFRAVNCIDTDRALALSRSSGADVAALRERLGLNDKKVILFVGALTRGKRLEDLIRVFSLLEKRHSDVVLLIVGDGPHRDALSRLAQELGTKGVVFVGQVIEDVHLYFEMGDVFVLPGLGGLAISEAMCHGLPVIATAADGCERDLVEEGRNGYLLEVGDRERLERCIEDILYTPGEVERLGAHSVWLIENRYNIREYMENLVSALEYAASR